MSGIACKFCAHSNPEGSKFCNECGSPLNFAPCPRCEAVNNVSDTECFQCGASLSWFATEAVSAPATALAETSKGAETEAAGPDSVPLALADRLEAVPWEPHIAAQEPRIAAEVPSAPLAAGATDSARLADDRSTNPPDGRYRGRKPNLALGLFLVVAFVAVGGGLYWIWSNQAPSTESPGGLAGPGPTTSTPAVAPPTADTPGKPVDSTSPGSESAPPAADTSDSPAKAAESTAPETKVQPPLVIDPASKRMAAQKPSGTATAKSSTAGTARTATAHASSAQPHGAGAPVRTTEQEERDALATRRLIERDLANSPQATSGDKPPPSQ
jgi:hypothetical protein